MTWNTIFPQVLEMSLTASAVIPVVLLVRLLLKRAPKVFSYLLWSVVLFRLLCPVSIPSAFSLMRLVTPVSETGIVERAAEAVAPGAVPLTVPEIDDTVVWEETPVTVIPETAVQPSAPEQRLNAVEAVWLLGMAGMAGHSLISWWKLRRRLIGAVPLRDNIWLADHIVSPFVMGLFAPKIYLPSSLSAEEQCYIILHEQHHIRRGDHWIRLLAFAALCIHWFNPMVWAAFLLAGKDMEMCCDEAVIRDMGEGIRADYSASLLRLAVGGPRIAGVPLAFGEGDPKGRIRNLAVWKKPALWVTLIAAVLCVGIIVFCALDAEEANDDYDAQLFSHSYRVEEVVYEEGLFSFTYTADTAPRYQLTQEHVLLESGSIADNDPTNDWMQLGSFRETELDKDAIDACFSASELGWSDGENLAARLRRENQKAWRLDYTNEYIDLVYYLLYQKNGDVYLSYGYDESDSEDAMTRWLFKLKRIDLITCNAVSNGSSSYIEPVYYPEGFDFGYSNVTEGVIYDSGTLIFDVDWETDTLRVSEEYYEYLDGEGVCHKKTYTLQRRADGTFALEVARRNDAQDEKAFYYIQGEEVGTYVLKISFPLADSPAYEIGQTLRGEPYVSWSCLYMNPLSSVYPGNDSGCRYLIGEDSVIIVNQARGDIVAISSMVDWEWQAFPWTDQEWNDLLAPEGLKNLRRRYDEILYLPLSETYCLLKVDGELWIVQLRENPEMGKYIWSVYSLVPEAVMGSAQWTYYPLVTLQEPQGFRFTFDLPHTEISAVCVDSPLLDVDANGDGREFDYDIILSGDTMQWSPMDENGVMVYRTQIAFTVRDGEEFFGDGTIYITAEVKAGGVISYTAKLVGGGFVMTQAEGEPGAVISLMESA